MKELSAEAVAGVTGSILAKNFDNPQRTPEFHHKIWDMCCSDYKYVAIAAPRGHSKAQSLDSRVLTPNGWTTIKNLRVGDRVIGGDGKPVRVTETHPISEMDLYRVTMRDGRSTLCNLDHLWNVVCNSNQRDKIQTKSLRDILQNWKAERISRGKPLTEYRYKIPNISPVEFPEKDHFIDPYLLGMWLGDGHSACGILTTADPEIFEYIPDNCKKRGCDKYGYQVEGLTKRLRILGVKDNKHLPKEYTEGSIYQRIRLLNGLMDSDGHVHQDGKIAYFSNTNYRIAKGVADVVRGLGGVAFLNECEMQVNGEPYFYWVVSIKFSNGINPFLLKRKREKWVGSVTDSSYIIDIQYEKTDLGRCITVENDTYITDDYLLTHNSTSVTVCYTLCELVFRKSSFALIVSATESNAAGFLDLIKRECTENEDLIQLFGIDTIEKDSYTDIIVKFKDGEKFRILAKGAEQKMRGLLWRGKRPDLVIGDDLEEDEQVLNKDRREKFRSWFFNALLPCISDSGKVRVVGTILHLDALLERLLHKEDWLSERFRAHNEDFSEVLWPERFPREKLEKLRKSYIEEGNLQGYSQEYLNWPIDQENSLFKKNQFLEMPQEAFNKNLNFYAAADFAISEKERGDFTVMIVGGTDEHNYLYIVETIIGRFDSKEIIDEMIAIQKRYQPECFWVETEKIDKALGPFLQTEMMRQNAFINIIKKTPTKDKIQRAQSIAARMKSGGVYFNKNDDNYDTLEDNLMKVTRSGVRGGHDDILDAFAWLGLGLAEQTEAPTYRELEDEAWEEEWEDSMMDDSIYSCVGY